MKLSGTVIAAVWILCGAPAIRAGAEDPKRAAEEAKREAEEAKREAEDDRREAEEERQKRDAKRAREAEEARKERDEDRRKSQAEREVHLSVERRKELTEKVKQKVDTKLFRSPEERAYRRGLEYLDARRWEKAIEAFDEVLGVIAPAPPAPPAPPAGRSTEHKMPPPVPILQIKGPRGPLGAMGAEAPPHRIDAALYWKAYALHKLGRRGDALAAIETIRKDHPQSGWLVQAKMLEVEVKQASGQAPSPESETDDELKLIALNALAKTDPERAVPLLEKIVTGPAAPGLQERALFVLAQSGSPRAREITARIVRGPSNPDLQMSAIRSLAAMGGDESHGVLADAYRRASTVEVKKAILECLAQAGAHDQVAELVRTETDAELLTAAVRSLMQGRRFKLRDGESSAGSAIADDRLVALYGDKVDARVRRDIVEILAERGNAHAVVALARKEKDVDLKREIVQRLSRMNDKEATEYLLEILSK